MVESSALVRADSLPSLKLEIAVVDSEESKPKQVIPFDKDDFSEF